jgi:Type IX secretion system membrane protein PorP/SprF
LSLKHTISSLIAVAGLYSCAITSYAQDVHFADAERMKVWCNPALKTNLLPAAYLALRTVQYPGAINYTSKAAIIELPLIAKDKDAADVIPFMNLSAGINTDNSKDGFLKVSTALVSLSYAVPLNDNNTWLSAGFQATYTFSRVGFGGSYYLPAQFDKYGAIGPAIAADPFESGYSFGYLNAGVGISIFHNGNRQQWYAGFSSLHLNKPYTEWTRSSRLAVKNGLQAGFTGFLTDADAIGGYGFFSWQKEVQEELVGIHYMRILDDSSASKITIGLAYRRGDALIPNLAISTGAHRLSFFYDINTGTALVSHRRKAFEFSYTITL